MEQDLFNQIKDSEYEMMDYYRINCINATGEYAPIKYILSPWHDAKSTYLYQLMGNELILEKEIMYKTPISELTDRFNSLKWNNNSVFAKFVTELDRFIWDNRESLGDEYWKINRLTDSEVLAANSYPDDTFVVYSALCRVIKVQTGSKPIKMLQKIIKSYPDNNVTSLQDFINVKNNLSINENIAEINLKMISKNLAIFTIKCVKDVDITSLIKSLKDYGFIVSEKNDGIYVFLN